MCRTNPQIQKQEEGAGFPTFSRNIYLKINIELQTNLLHGVKSSDQEIIYIKEKDKKNYNSSPWMNIMANLHEKKNQILHTAATPFTDIHLHKTQQQKKKKKESSRMHSDQKENKPSITVHISHAYKSCFTVFLQCCPKRKVQQYIMQFTMKTIH